jgi:transcription-repair coupling factor (superfamily II helicase)
MQVELIDRFGLLPDPAKNLMRIAAIKLRAAVLGIEKISASDGGGYVRFNEHPQVDPLTVIKLIQNEGRTYRMQGAHRLQFHLDLGDSESRFLQIERLLEMLTPDVEPSQALTG